MDLRVFGDAEALGQGAATLWLERLVARRELVVAVPAGRTPRPTYRWLREEARRRAVSFEATHVFAVDELMAPAPAEGYFWRHVREGLLAWAAVPAGQVHPFDPIAADAGAMCRDYERRIAERGGLDLVLLGLGPNGHLASNEPGSAFDSRTRVVRLLPETITYILTDQDADPCVGERAATLGLGTLADARELVVLVSGAAKRDILRRAVSGPVTVDCPASMLQRHPNALVLADRAAAALL
jgi:glucosamine-6-phosphate deaminase